MDFFNSRTWLPLLLSIFMGFSLNAQVIEVNISPSFLNPSKVFIDCQEYVCVTTFVIYNNTGKTDSVVSKKDIEVYEFKTSHLRQLIDSLLHVEYERPFVLDGVSLSINYKSENEENRVVFPLITGKTIDSEFFNELVKMAASTCETRFCKGYIRRLREYNRIRFIDRIFNFIHR